MKLERIYHCITLSVVLCLLMLSFPKTALAADWPVYRGPNHNGITQETDWSADWGADGPKQLWKADIGIGFSSIVVSDGRVFTMGNNGDKTNGMDTVFCFDAETGEEEWSHTYACPLQPKYYEGGTLATPTVDGNVVYTISKMGHIFCFDVVSGKIIWQKHAHDDLGCEYPTWHFSGSPMPLGELLVFNLGDAGLALNKKTGQVIWQNGKGACGYATPVPYVENGQQCVAIFGKDSVMGVRVSDGKVLWSHKHKTKYDVNASDPIMTGDTVFISSGYGRGCQKIHVSGDDTKTLWENENMRNHMNCSILWNAHIYGIDDGSGGQLRCLSFADGDVQWSEKDTGKGALVMSADGRMIIMSDKSELIIAKADPTEFKLIARAQILPKGKCWTTPTLANGRIYARNARGDMACVDVSSK